MPRSTDSEKTFSELFDAATMIDEKSAKEAGKLGYMARAMVQATLPHTRVKGSSFTRRNGDYTLHLYTSPDKELPYGSIPRLVLAWITREAVIKKTRELSLGHSLTSFMEKEVGIPATSGKNGNVKPFRQQVSSLFSCTVEARWHAANGVTEDRLPISNKSAFWWDSKSDPDQGSLFKSYVRLSEEFYDEIISRPVAIDLRAMAALKKSPLALDVYTWLTYRSSYLKRPTTVKWGALALQLGCEYGRTRAFKAAFLHELKKVSVVYRGMEFEEHEDGLFLKPGKPHVTRVVVPDFPGQGATLPSPLDPSAGA